MAASKGGKGKAGKGKPGKGKPVGYGSKGTPFYNLENYNQSKVGQKKGNPNPGHKGTKIVGYGEKGHPFYNLAKYNQSKVGQNKGKKPAQPMPGHPTPPQQPHTVMATPNPSAGQRAHAAHAQAGKPITITSHPAALPKAVNPVAAARGVKGVRA